MHKRKKKEKENIVVEVTSPIETNNRFDALSEHEIVIDLEAETNVSISPGKITKPPPIVIRQKLLNTNHCLLHVQRGY